uniref:Kinesin-like protein n=1 Tax=Chromera velia CCMP2878 TaxID=1169474 RepID=A0A0G4HQH1_9ALVE|eukprot:Cvel_1266.t1-p1 / transcript=Cvel_1266.t1 / gene=Cvel_1266 / organism=Chromera_velia_CCMP2878 / gene_product=Kinesin-II 95 kDa subunit, putative / transcript_product=Kinesin-II 95 kDa subunit, putative / location=Cvel_scaffold42:106614-119743(+) / protein_length=643 / sequence_SO=supercontig / SO=protein_coding / is_pseudo=false
MADSAKAQAAALASKKSECVRVVIRCRPMSEKEERDGRECIVSMDRKAGRVTVRKPKMKEAMARDGEREFTFDAVYDWTVGQQQIYDESAMQIVESVMEGYNDERGIIPRAFEHVFSNIEVAANTIRDLLSKNPKERLELKDHPEKGVYVKDLSTFIVKGVGEMRQVMAAGQKNRSVGSTLMNVESSRSHCIFTITVESCETVREEDHIRVGKLNMVDLAGSERQSKTGATGDVLKEATKINLSLSALCNVISALVDGRSSHIPYRDSKLTRLLQDSLGGNTRTVMLTNIGPADFNYDESLSTLRYAYRAKSIKNKPRINEDPKDAMIRSCRGEGEILQGVSGSGELDDGGEGEAEIVEKEVVVEKVVEKRVKDEKAEEEKKRLQQEHEREKAAAKQKYEEEKKRIEQARNIAESEKQRLLDELKHRDAEQKKQHEDQKKMEQNLKEMEEKMLQGTKVMAQAAKQEADLKKAKLEIERKREKELKLIQDKAKEEEERLALEEKANSQDEKIEKLTAKLQKCWGMYKNAKGEIDELAASFQTSVCSRPLETLLRTGKADGSEHTKPSRPKPGGRNTLAGSAISGGAQGALGVSHQSAGSSQQQQRPGTSSRRATTGSRAGRPPTEEGEGDGGGDFPKARGLVKS